MASSPPRSRSDWPFFAGMCVLGGTYVLLVASLLLADLLRTTPATILAKLADPRIQYAVKLSLVSCSITSILAVWVAVPLGYLLSRYRFRGKVLLDVLLDVPIVLPPLVIGLSLLILFQTLPGQMIDDVLPVTYAVPGVILAQFSVAAAFAVRTMRVTFDQISPRQEQVALTLGCSRGQAFWLVVLPQARRGIITALTLAWARSLGEFGPVLIFAGAMKMHTEVLPTAVYMEISRGSLDGAVAVSMVMVAVAVVVLVIVRVWGAERLY
jgi:molybdate transport system permease protein